MSDRAVSVEWCLQYRQLIGEAYVVLIAEAGFNHTFYQF